MGCPICIKMRFQRSYASNIRRRARTWIDFEPKCKANRTYRQFSGLIEFSTIDSNTNHNVGRIWYPICIKMSFQSSYWSKIRRRAQIWIDFEHKCKTNRTYMQFSGLIVISHNKLQYNHILGRMWWPICIKMSFQRSYWQRISGAGPKSESTLNLSAKQTGLIGNLVV